MKKRGYLLTLLALTSAVQLTACGGEKKETVEATEYAQINEINNSVADAYTIEGFAETEADEGIEEKEADGDEKTENREVAKKTDIYSKPETESAVVGSLKKGEKIKVFGILEDRNWYKVVYSGRIAYLPASAIKEKAEEKVVTEQEVQTDGVTDTTAPDISTGNENASQQNSSQNNNSQNNNNNQNQTNDQSRNESGNQNTTQTPSREPDNSSSSGDTQQPAQQPAASDTETKTDQTPSSPTKEPDTETETDTDTEPDVEPDPYPEIDRNTETVNGTETQDLVQQVEP